MAFPDVICACGCGEWFTPWTAGRKFKRGHKPDALKQPQRAGTPKPGAAAAGRPGTSTEQDAKASYLLAQANMRRELQLLEMQIEFADNEIEKQRRNVAALEAIKTGYVDRHELLTASYEALQHLCGKRPEVSGGSDEPCRGANGDVSEDDERGRQHEA